MSYDLKLFQPPEGVDPGLAYQELAEQEEREIVAAGDDWRKRPVPEPVRLQMQQLADLLKAGRPAFEQFQPVSPLPWIELTEEDLMVQITIYERSAGITIPYFRNRSEEMMACVMSCVEVLNSAAGYVAYDPQLGRIVTASDVGDMVGIYRGMDARLPSILGQIPPTLACGKKAWWKFW